MKKTTDHEFEQLKQLGVDQIIEDTHISHDAVRAFLNKDFTYFEDKASVIRFIKMIKSKYEYELNTWLKQYEQYRIENNIQDSTNPQDMLQVNQTEYMQHNMTTNNKSYIIGAIVAISIVLITILINTGNSGDIKNNSENQDMHNQLQEAITSKQEIIKHKINKKTLSVIPLDTNRHSRPKNNTKESITNDLNPEISEILDSNIVIDLNKSILSITNNDLTIKTNLGRMWVGIIDIDTYDKKSDIIEGTKAFPIYDNTVFITGHGHLTLSSGDQKHQIINGRKQYFYYKDNSFIKLTRTEYLYINKGIEW